MADSGSSNFLLNEYYAEHFHEKTLFLGRDNQLKILAQGTRAEVSTLVPLSKNKGVKQFPLLYSREKSVGV